MCSCRCAPLSEARDSPVRSQARAASSDAWLGFLIPVRSGGTVVTISGRGFNSNGSFVSVSFGSVPCAVLSTNFFTLTCRLASPLGLHATTIPATPLSLPLTISPSEGAPQQTFSGASTNFTFTAALTPVIVAASRTRGSTEGGTRVEFTVTNMVSELMSCCVNHGAGQSAWIGSAGKSAAAWAWQRRASADDW